MIFNGNITSNITFLATNETVYNEIVNLPEIPVDPLDNSRDMCELMVE